MKKKIIYFILVGMIIVLAGATAYLNIYVPGRPEDIRFNFVSGTEYSFGEQGDVIVELKDALSQTVDAPCDVTILYPNKTAFVSYERMNLTTTVGTQYYNFDVPDIAGVFEYSVNCSYGGIDYILGKSFHVSVSRYEISVQGTDYAPGDNGRVFLKLVKDDIAIDNEVCLITVHDPVSVLNSTSYFVNEALMKSVGVNGLYYYDFTAPSEEGIYMVSAKCFVGENTTVWSAMSDNLIEGTLQSGSINDTYIDDGVYYEVIEQNNGGSNRSYVHDFYFNLSDLNESLVTFAAVQFIGRVTPDTDDTIKMQVYNYSSSLFIDFDNEIPSQDGSNNIMVSNTGDGSGIPDFKNASGIIRVRLVDTQRTLDIVNNVIRIDSMKGGATVIVSTPIKEIAGGGEINIRGTNVREDVMVIIS